MSYLFQRMHHKILDLTPNRRLPRILIDVPNHRCMLIGWLGKGKK